MYKNHEMTLNIFKELAPEGLGMVTKKTVSSVIFNAYVTRFLGGGV